MSNAAEAEADENNNVCADCGIIELEGCDGCDFVNKCTENHRERHEEGSEKWTQQLHDRKLFRQPDISHLGECPLCFLPMPLDNQKSAFLSCCSKTICHGCEYAHAKFIGGGGDNCPFCREPAPGDKGKRNKRLMRRVKANDPVAISQLGSERYYEGDHDIAIKYWTMAVELGDVVAHKQLGYMYRNGEGVENDEEKGVYHYEMAAIGGHPQARHYLGCVEEENGNLERSVKHFIIAANLGHEGSMKELWKHYSAGNITKEELEATLRTHKAAIDAMKSPQREAAEALKERQRGAKFRY